MTPDRPADQNTVRNLDSPRQLAEWTSTLVAHHRHQLASTTPPPRHASATASAGIDDSSPARSLRTWEHLAEAFVRLQHKNLLVDGAAPAVLSTAFMAALEGGYLLSVIARHIAPLEVAIEMATSSRLRRAWPTRACERTTDRTAGSLRSANSPSDERSPPFVTEPVRAHSSPQRCARPRGQGIRRWWCAAEAPSSGARSDRCSRSGM
jgi:hypothetical protein